MKISIITITYNSEESIENTIKSVIRQDFTNKEYIIIDGNSTDRTLEIMEKYREHIDILISEKDKGIYDALNKGINAATGDVVGFMHSDDMFNSHSVVRRVYEAFATNNVDAVYGDLQYVAHGDFNKIIRHWRSGDYKKWYLRFGWMPPHPTFYAKKEVYQKFQGFDLYYKISADYDSMMRYLGKYGVSVAYIPRVLTKMQVGGVSNRNMKTIKLKMKEDVRAAYKNKIGFIYPIFFKNVRKVNQFIRIERLFGRNTSV